MWTINIRSFIRFLKSYSFSISRCQCYMGCWCTWELHHWKECSLLTGYLSCSCPKNINQIIYILDMCKLRRSIYLLEFRYRIWKFRCSRNLICIVFVKWSHNNITENILFGLTFSDRFCVWYYFGSSSRSNRVRSYFPLW